jgi:hypothetical protein
MGFTPAQVDAMSLWEFNACADAFAKANGAKTQSGGGDIADERLRELGIHGFDGT